MIIKRLISICLCCIMLFCISGCKKTADTLSSDYSTTSYIEQTQNISTNNSSNSSVDSSSNTTVTVDMEETYGFNTIDHVEYKAIKDTPHGDAEYEITGIITDKGSDIYYMCDITSKDPQITVDKNKIYVPYDFKKKNKAINLSVCHRVSGLMTDFTIAFDTWDLIFEDNFDGTEINTKVWNIWDYADWQYFYSPDAVFLDGNGHLVNRVSILETADSEYEYTRQSGAITTKDKYESTYGYYEISAKLHQTTGMWGAFWLLAGDMDDKNAVNDGSAVNGCEIDVFESIYDTKIPSHAIHWDGYTHTKSHNTYDKLTAKPEVFDGNFHTFAVRWSDEEYIFYIDGEVTTRANIMGICNQPAHMLISSHFGDWGGEVVMKPGEYTDMVVDYVRVYQNSSDPV